MQKVDGWRLEIYQNLHPYVYFTLRYLQIGWIEVGGCVLRRKFWQ